MLAQVQRLSGLDASFLYNETRTQHVHTLKYAILDVSGLEGGFTVERVQEELERRLHLLPPFRRRLVEVPLGLHHPVWIEDPDFNLDYHVRRVTAPPPGDLRAFSDVCRSTCSTVMTSLPFVPNSGSSSTTF